MARAREVGDLTKGLKGIWKPKALHDTVVDQLSDFRNFHTVSLFVLACLCLSVTNSLCLQY